MIRNKVYGMLGMAARAGKIAGGAFAAEAAIKSGKAYVTVIACDVSENTRDRYKGMCFGYGAPLYAYGSKEELGHAIGKDERAILAVTDESFAKAVEKLITSEQLEGNN